MANGILGDEKDAVKVGFEFPFAIEKELEACEPRGSGMSTRKVAGSEEYRGVAAKMILIGRVSSR